MISLAVAVPCEAAPPCVKQTSVPRKEFRQLTPAEWTAFTSAVTALKKEMRSKTVSTYDVLAKTHMDYQSVTHGSPMFLPWIRRYLMDFESHLRRVSGNGSLTVPYWDTHLDSQAPAASPLLTKAYMGGNGPVSTGVFSGWTPTYPSVHALTRQFDDGPRISPWESLEVVRYTLTTTTSYSDFRSKMETGNHARVHNGIGGDMKGMQAANDPIFWLAEANVDRNWAQWQKEKNGANRSKYEGRNKAGQAAALTDRLTPWPSTVADVMATEDLGYCYQ